MILVTKVFSNEQISIGYHNIPESVVVQSRTNPKEVKVFGGYDNLKELFDALGESFNEDIDYKTACDFFRPSNKRFEVGNK